MKRRLVASCRIRWRMIEPNTPPAFRSLTRWAKPVRTAPLVAIATIALVLLISAGSGYAQDKAETLISNVGQTESVGPTDLNSSIPIRAQRFRTGEKGAGYTLDSVGIKFGDITDISP